MDFYLVDAFETGPFTGNPAAVVPLAEWLPDQRMQQIGNEFNLSETAFFVGGDGSYELRWFTPEVEVDLCGHATLASAHVLFDQLASEAGPIEFSTRSGVLHVDRADGLIKLQLPAARLRAIETPRGLADALGADPVEVIDAGAGLVIVLSSEHEVRALQVDHAALKGLGVEMFCVTASAAEYDYVVRVFAPAVGIDEDPATGSAQCALAPYWSEKLGKSELRVFQASRRGAELYASWEAGSESVYVSGRCRAFGRGSISEH
jgi:PhzF family phenazine biosynthesis protein